MPHAIVKMYAGRTDRQKQEIAEAVTQAIVATAGVGEESVSVAMEEVAPRDWTEKVYKADILNGPGKLYKRPGYDPA